ncbi:MAG: hypothetical protein COV66_15460 [Nitrospinae bacterium CG11_big_fil_rev_8_21_14_0_20_45_15]|nr:MAG: hypothetical protein COV66_15460 [Nitrospinae bacterium CG11_big_fil_rev_8_21_14_0_20_45_15]
MSSTNNTAVLVLQQPPLNTRCTDWYLRPIAGVSLLLRNLLELNESNLRELFIYIPHCTPAENLLLSKELADPRLPHTPRLLEGKSALKEFLQATNHVKIFHGAFLHSNQVLKTALAEMPIEGNEPTYTTISLTEEEILQWEQPFISSDQTPEKIDASPFPSARLFILQNSRPLEKESDFSWHSKRLIYASGLSNDSFMDRVITRRISNKLTHYFVTTALTPNHITLMSLIIGLGSALLFFQGSFWAILAGAVALQISAWVDCVDGEVARLKFMKSEIGAEFDILCDNIVHISVFFCLGMGLYFETGQGIYKALGAFAVLGNLLSFALLNQNIIKGKAQADSHDAVVPEKKSGEPPEIANRDFTYYLLGFSLFGVSSWFLALTAVGSNIFAGYLVYSRRKQ